MAQTFKSAASGSTTSIQTLFTCPASATAVVHAMYLSNVDGTNDATISENRSRARVSLFNPQKSRIIRTADYKWSSSNFLTDIIH